MNHAYYYATYKDARIYLSIWMIANLEHMQEVVTRGLDDGLAWLTQVILVTVEVVSSYIGYITDMFVMYIGYS